MKIVQKYTIMNEKVEEYTHYCIHENWATTQAQVIFHDKKNHRTLSTCLFGLELPLLSACAGAHFRDYYGIYSAISAITRNRPMALNRKNSANELAMPIFLTACKP